MDTPTMNEKLGFQKQTKGFATKAIHSGQSPDQWKSRAVVPPISLSTTFEQFAPGQHAGFDYSRAANPTRKVLEDCLASLDNAKHALAFASGVGTQTAITSLVHAGDHIVSSENIYAGINCNFRELAENMGIEVDFVDASDLLEIQNALKPNTKMVWIETPTNPTLKVIDIESIAKIVHAKSSAFLVVDNTFLTPYFQSPLNLGADIVMYSLTKYMNGHSDVVMGSAATNSEELHKKLRHAQNATGIVPSAFDCYLVNRGLKTLSLRMEKHSFNSLKIAEFLETHPKVGKVMHPALKSHPQHKLALKQTNGHSGIASFYLKNADIEKSTKFLLALKYFALADSLGGAESFAQVPGRMAHADLPQAERERIGITDDLIRLSVGLEDVDDLIEDLKQALDQL